LDAAPEIFLNFFMLEIRIDIEAAAGGATAAACYSSGSTKMIQLLLIRLRNTDFKGLRVQQHILFYFKFVSKWNF
jgi:hypothetical protein